MMTEAQQNSSDEPIRSIVEYWASSLGTCGYCKRERGDENGFGRRTYDMTATTLTAQDYQDLLDRGWRRSGTYCYHPINDRTCCPNYSITCKATEFNLSHSQRRCIENFNSFLVYGETKKLKLEYNLIPNCSESGHNGRGFEELKLSSKARHRRFVKSCERKMKIYNISLEEAVKRTQARRINSIPKLASLEDYLYPRLQSITNQELFRTKHRLQIKLHHVNSTESESLRQQENNLIQIYQEKVHKESRTRWTMSRYSEFLVDTPLKLEPIKDRDYVDNCDVETQVSNLYSEESDYLLVKPPELPCSFGTYHCCYLLDDKLLAVGVLDILPKCVTTVYFFYDPDYSHLNLGIYSALVEISLVRQMSKHYSNPAAQDKLKYYYLGYYVHECKKMHYKTKFKPSFLLCSESFEYVPTELCLLKLKDKKFERFCPDPQNDFHYLKRIYTLEELSQIPVLPLLSGISSMLEYFDWLGENLGLEYVKLIINGYLHKYCQLVGLTLSSRLTLDMKSVHDELMQRYETLNLSK